jgi:NitT/TauT family transport system substrate-binding protein
MKTYHLVVAAAACALSALFSAPKPAVADDALTVVSGSSPSAIFEVIGDVAQYAGFYKEEHLVVTEQFAGNPSIAAQFVATGKADMCSISTEPTILGYEKGIRLVAFFSRDPRNQYVLGVLDSSPIKTLADFKGATLGEVSVGSPGEYAADNTLSGAGLRKGDVNYIPIGSAGQAFAALQSNKVAGAAYPYTGLVSMGAFEHVKFRYFFNPILTNISDTAYVTTPAVIAAKGDALRRFARASVKASILIRENPQLAARYFLQGAGVKITADSLQSEVDLLKLIPNDLPASDPLSKHIGAIPLRDAELYTKFLYGLGLTSQLVPASAVVTDEFIDYANDFDHSAWIAQVKKMH